MDELKKCKSERKLLLITLMVLILIYFSFPIVKVFQPKKIVIENAEGERYRFNIPWDWVYWKMENSHYIFYHIWDKDNILYAFFLGKQKFKGEIFLENTEKDNSCVFLRNYNNFTFYEAKANPNFSEDEGESFYVVELNCFIFYSGELFEKEKRIKKFLSNWEKMVSPDKD